MRGEGGTVDDKPIPEVIEGLRAMLAAIDEGRMSCSAGYRNRLQGAVVALEALNDRSKQSSMADIGTQYPPCDTSES